MTKLADLIRKPLVWAIGALILIGLVWWLVSSLIGGKNAKVEATLNGNVAGAALESGKDAVDTVGAQAASEGAVDKLTKENSDAIFAAPGASATVDPAAAAAGRSSLCKRAAYRERPECLQHAPAR